MSVAFCGSLAEKLRFGHILEVCAKAKEDANRFHVSLATGDSNLGESFSVGLHIIADFLNSQIILKKYINEEWCDEVSQEFETSELLKEFKVYIVMADEKFHISINGKLLECYQYRLRLSLMNFLEIDGDVEYVRQVDHRKYFPYIWPPIQVVEERVQFSNDVPMPFSPGHVVTVSAHLTGNEKGRFTIHLRNVCDSERQELHLSFRFDTKVMVRNSKTTPDGEHYSFDVEERDVDFPFVDFFQPFKLAFGFTDKEVKIAKDGVFLCGFAFRTPHALSSIGGLKIFGNNGVAVRVTRIDHVQLEDPLCRGFENCSQLQCLSE